MGCAVNSCPTSIITGGLGQPAKNSLISGMSRLNLKLCNPLSPVTPTSRPSNHHGILRDDDEINNISFRLQWYNGSEIFNTFQYDKKFDDIIFKINTGIEMKKIKFTVNVGNIEGFEVKWKK